MPAVDQPSTAALPRRVNLGCGFDHRPGYLNVDFQDFHHPDLVADVRDLSALPSSSFEEVLALDVLEHLERADIVPTLTEWCRILEPDGAVHIRTSDVIGLSRLMTRRDTVADHHHLIHSLFGTQAYKGDYHLAGFTDLTLIDHLFEAGLDRIRVARHHQWLLVADAQRPSEASPARMIGLSLDEGFHELESDGTRDWRACQAIAGILLFSRHDEPIDVTLTLSLSRPDRAVDVELHGPGLTLREVVDGLTTITAEVTVRPGPNRLSLVTLGPPIPAPDDLRVCHLQAHEIAFTAAR
jgi:hypothetical protein